MAFKRAIGSSYLIQQSPGAEMVGGLEVKVQHGNGQVIIETTLWHPRKEGDIPQVYINEAVKGVGKYAADNDINLSAFDITLRYFVYHPVDSRPKLYFLAGQNALQSAMNAWFRR